MGWGGVTGDRYVDKCRGAAATSREGRAGGAVETATEAQLSAPRLEQWEEERGARAEREEHGTRDGGNGK